MLVASHEQKQEDHGVVYDRSRMNINCSDVTVSEYFESESFQIFIIEF